MTDHAPTQGREAERLIEYVAQMLNIEEFGIKHADGGEGMRREVAEEIVAKVAASHSDSLQRHADALMLAERFIVQSPLATGQRAVLDAIREARVSDPKDRQ